MPIQWFPGHMHAARRKLEETLADVDVLIEVLDARIPAASRNPLLETLRRSRQRPCLKLLNKADLADPARTTEWIAAFEREEGVRALAVCAKNPADVRRILPACERLAPHRSEPTKPLRLMIAGIPNIGKSTLLNALIGRKAAKVGDEPAVTKSVQRYDLPGLRSITDTPGLMWPKIEFEADGYLLAACHAIGRNAVAEEEVAAFLAETLLAQGYADRLTARYRFDPTGMNGEEIVEAVGERRGCRRKGGELDREKAANILLQDFREGKLGPLTLETPASRAAMIAAHEEAARVSAEENAQPTSR